MSTIRFNTQFPGYEVLSELGRSNARILKARHLDTGHLVAIKHFALHTDAETLRRFQRESAIMSGIDHPNIVKIREVRLDADLPYIVMELIEGGSLRNLMTGREQLDMATVTRLGLQLASAFNAFHPQGIVHRDIKPENILYRPLPSGELHFLLTDFGVARLHEQAQTMTGQSLMTYEYASPEQFSDPKNVGIATDYYSLGVVLYECLTGHVPFAMGDQAGIVTFMNRVLHEAPPLPITTNNAVVERFSDLTAALLTKRAVDRLSDPAELIWRLKQAELDYLQTARTPLTSDRTAVSAAQKEPAARQAYSPEAIAVSPARSVKTPNSNPSRQLKWLIPVLLVLLGGIGIYYFVAVSTATSTAPITQLVPTSLADPTDSTAGQRGQFVDSVQIRQAEEARLREQRRQEILDAVSSLSVEVTGFKVGFLGGISEATLQLHNPSPVAFTSVEVLVEYYKEKGGLFKSEKVYFTDIGPNASPTRTAPDSDRGTRLICKVIGYTVPDYPTPSDSSATVL